jgi:hypothetical protein
MRLGIVFLLSCRASPRRRTHGVTGTAALATKVVGPDANGVDGWHERLPHLHLGVGRRPLSFARRLAGRKRCHGGKRVQAATLP